MEFLEILETFSENMNDGSCCCEELWLSMIKFAAKLFKGVLNVLITKFVGVALDAIVLVKVFGESSDDDSSDDSYSYYYTSDTSDTSDTSWTSWTSWTSLTLDTSDTSDDSYWYDEDYVDYLSAIYIIYQRSLAVFLMLLFFTCLPSRRDSLLKRDENYLSKNLEQTSKNNNNNNTNNNDDDNNVGGGGSEKTIVITKDTIILETEDPAKQRNGENNLSSSSGQSKKLDKALSSEDRIAVENNLYIGSHFIGIDLCGKIIDKKVTDGDCSKRDCCYSLFYLIFLLIDILIWFTVAYEMAWLNSGKGGGKELEIVNLVFGGFIGHLQHYFILFVAPIKSGTLKNSCSKKCSLCSCCSIILVAQIIFLISVISMM